jgi:hypothetical protein
MNGRKIAYPDDWSDAVKRSKSIVEDFESIRRNLKRLENQRALSLSVQAVVVEEDKSEGRTSISHLWISGKI